MSQTLVMCQTANRLEVILKALRLLSLFLVFLSFSVSADVWVHRYEWNEEFEREFSEWMKTEAVNKDMFVASGSRWYGLSADCADAAYGLRAIFSYLNELPFAFTNPSAARSGRYRSITNSTGKFDHISNPDQRVVRFVNYLADVVGSSDLTYYDSFPQTIKSIRAGDMFTYRISARFGRTIRHVYNIKEINPTGSFDVIYSTQAIRKKNLPMMRRKEKEFTNLPNGNWGFRRFRWPSELGLSYGQIPLERGRSNEQYALVNQLGRGFFKHVKKTLATVTDTPQMALSRGLRNLCVEAKARVDYVKQGNDFRIEIGDRCMNYEEFDAYSTPARDKALKGTFTRLKETLDEIVSNGQGGQVDPMTLERAQAVFTREDSDLGEFCSIEWKAGHSVDLSELYRRQEAGLLSSHPNDNIDRRWGVMTGRKTKCKRWY